MKSITYLFNATSAGFLMGLFTIICGCGEKPKSTPKEPAKGPGNSAIPAARGTTIEKIDPASVSLFITPYRDDDTVFHETLKEVPYEITHRAVLWFPNMPTNQTFLAHWRLIDADGQSYPLKKPDFSFSPHCSPYWISNGIDPSKAQLKYGKWTWCVSIQGVLEQRTQVMILPEGVDDLGRANFFL
jgi:hypothetical protein